MSEYLINLARFVSYKEKKEIFKELKNKNYKVSNDPWSYRRLIVDRPIKNKAYAASVIELKDTFSPKTISDTVQMLSKYKIKEIKAKIGHGVPFHAKAILDRYFKKNKYIDNGETIYLEANMVKEKPEVRIGTYIKQEHTTINISKKTEYPNLVIETPYTLGEISDFVRLSKVFKIKVYIITNNDRSCLDAIEKFLETNSFDKGYIEIIKSIDKIKDNYDLIGFSMWGRSGIQEVMKKTNKKKLLLFGNERRGLLKSTMDSCSSLIKIGSASEPLRATQAATFALGYIFSKS